MKLTDKEQKVVDRALRVLKKHMISNPIRIASSEAAVDFLKLKIGVNNNETFAVFYLTKNYTLIDYREEFSGTFDSVLVHPRVIAQHALILGAAAVILAHNHPSGVAEITEEDIALTKQIADALTLIDVTVVEHVIVAGDKSVSFLEQNLIPTQSTTYT